MSESLFGDGIAGTRAPHEALGVQDVQVATMALNDFFVLQRSHCECDSFSVRAEHLRERLHREVQSVIPNAVSRGEEPTSTPLTHPVHRVTRGGMRNVGEK